MKIFMYICYYYYYYTYIPIAYKNPYARTETHKHLYIDVGPCTFTHKSSLLKLEHTWHFRFHFRFICIHMSRFISYCKHSSIFMYYHYYYYYHHHYYCMHLFVWMHNMHAHVYARGCACAYACVLYHGLRVTDDNDAICVAALEWRHILVYLVFYSSTLFNIIYLLQECIVSACAYECRIKSFSYSFCSLFSRTHM